MNIANNSNNNTNNNIPTTKIPRITVTSNTSLLKPHQIGDKNLYNQYACIRCRRLKKKCSKELPQCANCTKQNESCKYVERKNKRKSSSALLIDKKLRKSISTSSSTSSTTATTATTATTTTSSNSTNSSAPTSHSNSLSSLSDSERENSYVISPSPSNSLPQIQLPPLLKSDYPQSSSLSSYSLQQSLTQFPLSIPISKTTTPSTPLLPSLPKQLYNIPIQQQQQQQQQHLSNPQFSATRSDLRDRSNSKSSIRSLSPTSQIPINDYSNILFQHAPNDSIQFETLQLIMKKLNLLDNNLISVSFNLNLNNLPSFEDQFFNLFDFITFIDKNLMIPFFQNFKFNKFNWNGINLSNIDYYNSIEFLLLITCSLLIISNNSILDPYYYKFTFTMANKLINTNSFKFSNIQILRISTILQFIAFFSNSNLNIIYFIQIFLTNYSLKWKLNYNLKQKLNRITLTDIEYSNRLFWSIYIFDSFISSTTSEQSLFQLNNINVQNPLAIIKDEEIIITTQIIIINLFKIQSKILNQIYSINSNNSLDNSNKFSILSLLRQEADFWYNDCRILLSKFSEENNSNLIIEKLQNFAAWISQEYYYTLIILFKPSILFPNPESPNFTVISNATFQNTQLLNDLLLKNKTPLSLPLFTRFSITSLYALISLYKGTFTINESITLINNMLQIWSKGKSDFTKNCHSCLLNLNKISIFTNSNLHFNNNNIDEIYLPIENSALVVRDSIYHFINLMNFNGVNVEVDQTYINNQL